MDGLKLFGAVIIAGVILISWGWGLKAIISREAQASLFFQFRGEKHQPQRIEGKQAIRFGLGQFLIGCGFAFLMGAAYTWLDQVILWYGLALIAMLAGAIIRDNV